jgi:O-antigen/teichoic acid export membrane protein
MNRDLLLITAGRVVQIIVSLASVKVFTALLSQAEVGNLYLIYSLLGFITLVFINPVGSYLNRRLHAWREAGDIVNAFFVFNIYLAITTISSVGIVYAAHDWLGIGGTIDLEPLILFMSLMVYFQTWNQVIIPAFNMLDYRGHFVTYTCMTQVIGFFASYGLVMLKIPSAIYWVSGQLLAYLVVALAAAVSFQRLIRGRLHIGFFTASLNRESIHYIARFVIPLGVTALFMWLQNQSYRMVVEQTIGLEFLGLLGLGISIAANISTAVEAVVQQTYLPIFYREINHADPQVRTEAWNRMAQLILPVFISLVMLITILAPYLVTILANARFQGAVIFVVFGAWIELLRLVTGILSTVAHSEMKTRALLKSYCCGGVIAVVGTFAVSRSSAYAYAIPAVLVLGGLVGVYVMYHDMKKLMRFTVGIRRIGTSLVHSLPLLLALFFYPQHGRFFVAAVVTLAAGGYFLLVQYRLARQVLAPGMNS